MTKDRAMFWEARIGRWLWSGLAIGILGEAIWLLIAYPFKPSIFLLFAMSLILAFTAYSSNRLYKLIK